MFGLSRSFALPFRTAGTDHRRKGIGVECHALPSAFAKASADKSDRLVPAGTAWDRITFFAAGPAPNISVGRCFEEGNVWAQQELLPTAKYESAD